MWAAHPSAWTALRWSGCRTVRKTLTTRRTRPPTTRTARTSSSWMPRSTRACPPAACSPSTCPPVCACRLWTLIASMAAARLPRSRSPPSLACRYRPRLRPRSTSSTGICRAPNEPGLTLCNRGTVIVRPPPEAARSPPSAAGRPGHPEGVRADRQRLDSHVRTALVVFPRTAPSPVQGTHTLRATSQGGFSMLARAPSRSRSTTADTGASPAAARASRRVTSVNGR